MVRLLTCPLAKLCRNFALGYCPQGENCKYLHTTNIPIEQTFTMASTAIPTMVRRMAHPYNLRPRTDSVCVERAFRAQSQFFFPAASRYDEF